MTSRCHMKTWSFPMPFHVIIALWRYKHLSVVTTLSLLCTLGMFAFFSAGWFDKVAPSTPYFGSFPFISPLWISLNFSLWKTPTMPQVKRDIASISLSIDINCFCFCFSAMAFSWCISQKPVLCPKVHRSQHVLECFFSLLCHARTPLARPRRSEQKPFLNKSHQTESWWCGKDKSKRSLFSQVQSNFFLRHWDDSEKCVWLRQKSQRKPS